jgi:hypothetical protein
MMATDEMQKDPPVEVDLGAAVGLPIRDEGDDIPLRLPTYRPRHLEGGGGLAPGLGAGEA